MSHDPFLPRSSKGFPKFISVPFLVVGPVSLFAGLFDQMTGTSSNAVAALAPGVLITLVGFLLLGVSYWTAGRANLEGED